MDIWSLGFTLHKVLTKELPFFDPSKKPVLNKGNISLGMNQLITKCLDEDPSKRPAWKDVNIQEVAKKSVMIEEVQEQDVRRSDIFLGSRNEKRS